MREGVREKRKKEGGERESNGGKRRTRQGTIEHGSITLQKDQSMLLQHTASKTNLIASFLATSFSSLAVQS